jgi:hypothetical protein
MMESSSKNLVYGCILVGFVGALMAFIGGSIWGVVGGIIAGVCSLFGVLFWKYGYLLLPLITQKTNIVMKTDSGFEVPPSNDVITKEINGIYYASAFLGIRIYESSTEKTTEQNITYNEYFERAISGIKYVTKIAYLLYVEDIGQKRKTIETKRAEAQLRLARERDKGEPDVLKMDRYEKEVEMYDQQLNKLIKGIKPMGVLAYAMTTAAGVSKEGAVASVRAQANELKSVLANALNVEVKQLAADEMLKCFEWEMFFPVNAQELESSVV